VNGTTVSGERRSPFLFAVGCPRSGTTLLQRMLDHHPMVAVANDTHFIPKVVDSRGGDVPLSAEIVDRVLAYHRFPRLGLPEDSVRLAAARSETYAQFVSSLYTEFGARRGKPLAGEKTPDYVRYLPLLGRLFPWALFIHLIRDGRDVALSAMQWARPHKGPGRFAMWEEEPVAVCALWWRWQVSAGRSKGLELGSRYREERYEQLVADPAGTAARLCRFVDLPFSPKMVAFHVGKTRRDPGLSAKKAWLPPTRGLRDWRMQMIERDVALFEALAGDLLSLLGYHRATDGLSQDIASLADRCRRRWDAEMQQRETRRRAATGS
jgi:hypothetical protein